jgi:hypothetical protein
LIHYLLFVALVGSVLFLFAMRRSEQPLRFSSPSMLFMSSFSALLLVSWV